MKKMAMDLKCGDLIAVPGWMLERTREGLFRVSVIRANKFGDPRSPNYRVQLATAAGYVECPASELFEIVEDDSHFDKLAVQMPSKPVGPRPRRSIE